MFFINDDALACRLLIQPMDELCDEKKEQEPSHPRHDFRLPVMMFTLANPASSRKNQIMIRILLKLLDQLDYDPRRVMRRGI